MSAERKEASPTVSWFELFYDLVVVAAVGLTNDAFLDSLTAGSARAACIGILALTWVWFLTTLFNNVCPGHDLVRRLLTLLQMAAIITASLAIDRDSDAGFRLALVSYAIALLVVVLLIVNDRVLRPERHSARLRDTAAAPLSVSLLICLIGAAIGGPLARWFLVAALLASAVPILGWQYRYWKSDPRLRLNHLRERLGLFVLIVLGEGFAQTVTALHSLGTIPRGSLFALTFLVSFAMWWIYFDGTFSTHLDLDRVRWRLTILGHLTLVLGMGGALDILALLTAKEEEALGPRIVEYFTFSIAVVLFSFALLRFAAKGGLGATGIMQLVSGVGLIALGLASEEPDMSEMTMVVGVSAAVVIANGLASAWIDGTTGGTPRARLTAVFRGAHVD